MTTFALRSNINLHDTKGGEDMATVNGNMLKAKIVEKGYTVAGFAKTIGVSKDTLYNVVNNNNRPSYNVMNSIFYALKLKPEEAVNIFFSDNLHNKKVSAG